VLSVPTRSATRSRREAAIAVAGRERLAAALARRAARERLVLTLLLYERLTPAEVAGVLRLSLRQVERTYHGLIAELRRSLRPARRPSDLVRRRRAA